jgi:hypothetical protein
MSDQTSIFTNTDNTQQTTSANTNNVDHSTVNNAPVNNGFADLLSQIKNERGEPKYRTPEDALKGLLHSQQFIETLKAEKAQADAEVQRLREEAQRVQTLEDTIKQLTTNQTQNQNTTAPVMDESKIAELVTKTLTQREQQAIAAQNTNIVVNAMQTAFGAEASKTFYEKGAELGLGQAEMNALAAKSPAAVMKMFGLSEKQTQSTTVVTPTTGTINTSGVQHTPQTFIKRNEKSTLVGASSEDLAQASQLANKMVEEVHAKGMTIHDLTDPKKYKQLFGN